MQGNKNVQGKIGAQVRSGNSAFQRKPIEGNRGAATAETGVQGGSSGAKKPQNTFLQGCLGCFGVFVMIGIVVIIAVAIWGAYFGRIRTLIPETSGQRFGIIRTA